MPSRTLTQRRAARDEACAPHRRGISARFGRQHSKAHQASARLEQSGGKWPPGRSLKASCGAEAPASNLIWTPSGSEYRAVSPLNRCPRNVKPGTAARARTTPSCRPRGSRWLWERRKTLESPEFGVFRRCTGRLNATQPGVIAVSTPYIRGLGGSCKGSVFAPPQSCLFTNCTLRSD